MNIYERLKRDHDAHREQLRKIMDTSGDSEERNTLFDEFYREAEAHAAAEEQTFYAALIEKPDGQEKARHSVHEHKEAADLLDELKELDMGSGGWLQKFKKLKKELEHHMDEEENEIFARAKKLIAKSRAEELAGKFDKRKRQELKSVA